MPFLQYSNIGNINVKQKVKQNNSKKKVTHTDKKNNILKFKMRKLNGFKIKPIFVGFENSVFWEWQANTRKKESKTRFVSITV